MKLKLQSDEENRLWLEVYSRVLADREWVNGVQVNAAEFADAAVLEFRDRVFVSQGAPIGGTGETK